MKLVYTVLCLLLGIINCKPGYGYPGEDMNLKQNMLYPYGPGPADPLAVGRFDPLLPSSRARAAALGARGYPYGRF